MYLDSDDEFDEDDIESGDVSLFGAIMKPIAMNKPIFEFTGAEINLPDNPLNWSWVANPYFVNLSPRNMNAQI